MGHPGYLQSLPPRCVPGFSLTTYPRSPKDETLVSQDSYDPFSCSYPHLPLSCSGTEGTYYALRSGSRVGPPRPNESPAHGLLSHP